MNRLTKSSPLTEYEPIYATLTDLYMRLKAYEDTGLEPEEVRGIKTAYDEVQIPYEVVATGADAARVIRLLDAEDEGRLLVLDREAALAIAAGLYAIGTTKKFDGASYFHDLSGEHGGPYKIPYLKAGEILFNIFDKYPLDGEDAEKALEGMNNDEC